MARAQVPTVDPRDPDGMRKALRAIEMILQEHGDAVDLLLAQRATVPLTSVARGPDNKPVPTAITTTFNQDGSMTVELRWTYIQGERPSTQTVIVIKKGPAPLAKTVYWEDDVYTVPTGAQYARIDLPCEHNYRFGVAVARGTKKGLEVGEVQAPTANPDWADIGGVAPVINIAGLVTGKIWTLPADVNLPEATWTSISGVTIAIPAWATDTKVQITVALNFGVTVITAGVFQLFLRFKRGTTVLFTTNQTRFDTSGVLSSAAPFIPFPAFMDATNVTGNQTYTVELFKDDIATGSVNNTVVVKAASQIAVSFWSY
jgi:hypothetical protein